MAHSMPETTNTYSRNGHLTNKLTKELKIEESHIIIHLSDHQNQHVNNMAFMKGVHPGQVSGFAAFLYLSTTIVSCITPM